MPCIVNLLLSLLILMCSIAAIGSDNSISNKESSIKRRNIIKNPDQQHFKQQQHAANLNISAIFHTKNDAANILLRNKRGTNNNKNFQLDQSELARQNQITQQIFANYLERRLFPNRSINQKIPTIEDILPKPVTTLKPRARGYKRGTNSTSSSRGRKRKYGRNRQRNSSNSKKQNEDEDDEENGEGDEDMPKLDEGFEHAELLDHKILADVEDFDVDGQESLQSVESEQHDHYYGNLFQRDPSENEIDSGK